MVTIAKFRSRDRRPRSEDVNEFHTNSYLNKKDLQVFVCIPYRYGAVRRGTERMFILDEDRFLYLLWALVSPSCPGGSPIPGAEGFAASRTMGSWVGIHSPHQPRMKQRYRREKG